MQQSAPILHSDTDNLSVIRVDGYYDPYHLIAVYFARRMVNWISGPKGTTNGAGLDLGPTSTSMKPSGTFRLLSCDGPFSTEELWPKNQF